MSDNIYDILSTPRAGYEAERRRHRFLLDAYAGTGGFAGKERMPLAGFWGWAAEVYDFGNVDLTDANVPESDINTYIDRYESEDIPALMRRVSRSHYPNYIAPSIDIPLSFMHRKPLLRRPDSDGMSALADWMDNADGSGTPWDDLKRDTIIPRAAVLGWCPVLFDIVDLSVSVPSAALDPEDDVPNTRANDRARGRRVEARPLFPSNLLDWEHDQSGVLKWVRMCVKYVRRHDPLQKGVQVERYTIYERDRWRWWEFEQNQQGGWELARADEGENVFGEVPITVMRRKPVPDDPFRGIPMAGDASNEARRLFNALSELDEHLTSCAFAFLQVPTTKVTPNKKMVLGSGKALPVGHDWSTEYKWVSPDTSVATTYEARIASIIEEIYRMQKMDFTRGTKGGGQRSGISQAFEFESANRTIADLARQDARFDQTSLRMISPIVGGPKSESIKVTARQNYNVEEMKTELEDAFSAVKLGLGTIAEAELRKKVVRSMLPHLDEETQRDIEDELDELAERARDAADVLTGNPLPGEAAEAERQLLEGDEDDEDEGDDD